jgi:hypothetical protein
MFQQYSKEIFYKRWFCEGDESMVDGIVKQLRSGVVIECSAVEECMKANTGVQNVLNSNGCIKRNCVLSVSEHGDRCSAYPCDTTTWLIDIDTSRIKQIPT